MGNETSNKIDEIQNLLKIGTETKSNFSIRRIPIV